MGYMPIIVALLGFTLLFSIYIYNQIKPRKANITKTIDRMEEVSRERKQLILGYHNSNEVSPLAEVAMQLKKTSTDRFQSFNKEEALIDEINLVAPQISDKPLSTQIQRLNEEQKQLLRKLRTTSGEYNRFIASPANKMVASLFGFKTF
ncbi:hypothetical protein AWW67_18235 [Roseivirga seohaensis]|uniref:LemA family protein n=1 Tax=Roseivirga seohaensis TaxID=1914963 RepID=A0A150Y148_9BACT|nr:hypothetical protein [Roseivirga seohaensis]KYG84632.1 hypothetical protein AWW67_18235 [Roseivirga seohaensis]